MKRLIEHITGKRLMKKWGVDEQELLQITKKGLFAYEPADAFESERIRAKYSKLGIDMSAHDFKPDYIDGFGDPFRCVFPEESQKIPLLIFKIEDIESFEDVFGFGKTEDKPVP